MKNAWDDIGAALMEREENRRPMIETMLSSLWDVSDYVAEAGAKRMSELTLGGTNKLHATLIFRAMLWAMIRENIP